MAKFNVTVIEKVRYEMTVEADDKESAEAAAKELFEQDGNINKWFDCVDERDFDAEEAS